MPADEIWYTQMKAGQQGDWGTVSACFAPDCTWTLMPPGKTFRGRTEVVTFMQAGLGAAAEREEADVRNEFAADDWGVFEYTSRGVIDAERAARFAEQAGVAGISADDLVGRTFEVPVCFIYHLNSTGLIDRVNEYVAAMPGLPAAT